MRRTDPGASPLVAKVSDQIAAHWLEALGLAAIILVAAFARFHDLETRSG